LCRDLVEIHSGGARSGGRIEKIPVELGLVDLHRGGADFPAARFSSRRFG